ncbi:MAG: hypothetical protein D6803_00500 [Anaerolineae bacterium]|nr:MAG: hypothetical protein D6803_00500 [Anaerolineae bacterium]
MTDLFERVTGDQDIFKQIASKIPGFGGYVERQNRRAADKLLRETVADRFEELYRRISAVQADFVGSGDLQYVDDLEKAALKIRTFIDKIRRAAYGYSGFFDAVKINEDELAQLYAYDAALLDLVDTVGRAIDNVEASVGSDGLQAAIRHLITQAQECLTVFERRSEVVTQSGD